MKPHPLQTEAEYRAALDEVARLFDAPDNTPEADRLEVMAQRVEAYEAAHYRIDLPDKA